MAKLIVKLHGSEVTKITLESGMEYIAGRAQDVAIPLSNERGISRHHLKFYERDGQWVCESLSKFVQIHMGSSAVDLVELQGQCSFSVPPYEFFFESEDIAAANGAAESNKSENLPAPFQPRVNGPIGEHTSPGANNEATVAGGASLIPYIRVSYPNTADDEVLKLEGHLWVAGRDPACEIPIDSAHVSRKHFELVRMQEGFFVTDLGSSNGTRINGQRLPAHEPTRLESGDEIQVMNVKMFFEIRDAQFSSRMDLMPIEAFNPALVAPPMPWIPQYNDEATQMREPRPEPVPTSWKEWRPHHLKQVDWKKHKVRVALVGIIVVMMVVGLSPTKPKSVVDRDPAMAGASVVFDNLTPEQKLVVKDSFTLARNLYVQGKYELCLTELAKVHELIPQFENSKELQSFCEQGRSLVVIELDRQRKERERSMIEQQISGYVEACKQKLSAEATVDETRTCLADAMELDPEHQSITEMIQSAQLHEEEKKFLAEEKQKTDRRAEQGEAHFKRAKAMWKDGKLAKAIREYEKFIDSSYPKVDKEKAEARRDLASIKKELKTKVDYLVDQCKTLGSKNRFKEAYIECDKAVNEDPSLTEIKAYKEKMLTGLRKEMKSIYEDSVLEESLGNVDSAKEKWNKILKENLDFDDYTAKAKEKLGKYD